MGVTFFIHIEKTTQKTQSLKQRKELNDDHTHTPFEIIYLNLKSNRNIREANHTQTLTHTQLLKVIDIVLNYSATKQQNQLLILLTEKENNRECKEKNNSKQRC